MVDKLPYRRRISLPGHVAIQLVTHSYEEADLAQRLQEAIDIARNHLIMGYEVDLPGLGVIEPYIRPSRCVRANFHGPDAPTYRTGPRLGVRLHLHEGFRKMVNRQQKALDEWAAAIKNESEEDEIDT